MEVGSAKNARLPSVILPSADVGFDEIDLDTVFARYAGDVGREIGCQLTDVKQAGGIEREFAGRAWHHHRGDYFCQGLRETVRTDRG